MLLIVLSILLVNFVSMKNNGNELQTIDVLDFGEKKTFTMHAHEKLVSSLAVSNAGLLASTSHDKHLKFWK